MAGVDSSYRAGRSLIVLSERVARAAETLVRQSSQPATSGRDQPLRQAVQNLQFDVETLDSAVRSLRLAARKSRDRQTEKLCGQLLRRVAEVERPLRALRKELAPDRGAGDQRR